MALKIFEKFSPRANPADADYPYGSIKNESVPGAKDGTPLDASWGNDMLGFTDALLDEAGITHNGLPDTVQSSQRLEAVKTVVSKVTTNNLSQSYTFKTVSDFQSSDIAFPIGKQVRLLDRYSSYTVISGTGTANGFDIIANATTNQSLVFNDVNGGLINVRQMGVVGDSTDGTDGTDDTEALRHALTYPRVRGLRDLKVRTTQPITISNECQFKLMGMTIYGQTTADDEPWFYIRSDNVDVTYGKFGNGVLTGKPFVVGDYNNPDNVIRGVSFGTNKFNIGDMPTNRGVISAVGRVFDLTVSDKNRFQSGANLGTKNVACVMMQLSSATVDATTQLGWDISKNTSVGIPYLFNNFSSAYAANVDISRNTVRNGVDSLRTYHLHDCDVSHNRFIECTGLLYIWQRTGFSNNLLQRCGDGVAAVKFETPSSKDISDNDIRNSVGAGAVLDGGNSNFNFTNNNIWRSNGPALIVNPNFAYGGQINGTVISGGRLTENFGHGITTKVTSALRNMTIDGVYIAANGIGNAGVVACLHFDTTANQEINDLLIANCTLRNNDVVGGIQDAKTQVALWFEGGTSHSSSYRFIDNFTYTDDVVTDTRTGGGGVAVVANNLVKTGNLADPGLLGVSWFNNYDEIGAQTGHRRNNGTPVGALVPRWLGEEVFDTSGQNWYKSVGASLGPWDNTNWKVIT